MYPEYLLISEFYGDRCARRSGVRLMNHIDEGILILKARNAGVWAERAFCLHPLLQADSDLAAQFEYVLERADARAIALAMEYRNVANAWLSDKVMPPGVLAAFGQKVYCRTQPRLSSMPEVNQMLVADKVQNRKDFLKYHRNHDRFDQLDYYFQEWLYALRVDEAEYDRLCEVIEKD